MVGERDRPAAPERLYSLGPDLAGIVGENGVAFEIWGGERSGEDIFISIGRLDYTGLVDKRNQIHFDLPSVINGGGVHPETSEALFLLRKAILEEQTQEPDSADENCLPTSFSAHFSAHLTTINYHHLRIGFTSFSGLILLAEGGSRSEEIFLFSGKEIQKRFLKIISAFNNLAKAIEKDNSSPFLPSRYRPI